MRIEGVAISCYRFDVDLTRLCVASIRFWYPHIPIWLLKDRQYGDFDTDEIEIDAKAAGNPAKDQMRLMMHSLLVERFHLAVHY